MNYLIVLRNIDTLFHSNDKDESKNFVANLSENMRQYMDILEQAFSPDILTAFNGSVELAKEMGVPAEEILDTKEKVVAYFLN